MKANWKNIIKIMAAVLFIACPVMAAISYSIVYLFDIQYMGAAITGSLVGLSGGAITLYYTQKVWPPYRFEGDL